MAEATTTVSSAVAMLHEGPERMKGTHENKNGIEAFNHSKCDHVTLFQMFNEHR